MLSKKLCVNKFNLQYTLIKKLIKCIKYEIIIYVYFYLEICVMVAKKHVCQCSHRPSKGVTSWEKIRN
jgi:hypothetical protein